MLCAVFQISYSTHPFNFFLSKDPTYLHYIDISFIPLFSLWTTFSTIYKLPSFLFRIPYFDCIFVSINYLTRNSHFIWFIPGLDYSNLYLKYSYSPPHTEIYPVPSPLDSCTFITSQLTQKEVIELKHSIDKHTHIYIFNYN